MISCMIKKFLKQLDDDAPVIWPDCFVIHEIGHQKRIVASKSLFFSDSLSPVQRVVFFSVLFTCTLKAQNTKLVHASTTASSLSAMLEKHGLAKSNLSSGVDRLARQSRTCRVVSSWAKWNLGLIWWYKFYDISFCNYNLLTSVRLFFCV